MEADERKHIMLIGPAYPYRGGIAHFLESTAEALEKQGHQVSIVSFSRQYPGLLFPGKSQYESNFDREAQKATRLIDSINPLSWFKTIRYIKRSSPDIVVFNYWLPFFAPSYGIIAERIRTMGITVLGLVHNALPHEKRPGDTALSRFFLSKCDGVIVLSEKVKADVRALGFERPVKIVGHPVYSLFGEPVSKTEAREELGLPQHAPVALFFGFIRPYKGLNVLMSSLPDVVERIPDFQLLVAGESYEGESEYQARVAELQLEDHVQLHINYIPGDRVKVYFCAADLIVQPYISATQSGVAQIAYHFDRPMIVTDVGGLAEFVPHEVAGLVVPPDNSKALSSAILRFFEEGLRDQLAEGVKQQKEKYSWARLCEAIENLAGVSYSE